MNAFDDALLKSGISDFNIVKISSILPPFCEQVTSFDLPKGSVLFTAYEHFLENSPGITISAAVSIAIPINRALPGVIMEISGRYDQFTVDEMVNSMSKNAMKSRGINAYVIKKESISMVTKVGYNCVLAAVAIW